MLALAVRALGPLAVLGCLALPSSTRAAQEPSAPPVDVELEVRVSTGGPDEAALERAVEERVTARLGELGHAVRADELVELDISVGWYDDTETTFAVTLVIRRGGKLVSHATETCPRCGTTELFELLAARVDRAEEHLATLAAAAALAAPPPEPANEDVPVPSTRKTRLTGLGWTGVAVTSAGVVMSAVGAGLWSKGTVLEVASGNDLWLEGRDYRPPGITLVAIGSTFVVGGVVMLVADVVRARHRRATVAGMVDSEGVMAVVTGRF